MDIFGDTGMRLYRALGPVGAAMLLDFGDLATFGPLGFVLGPIVGALAGWWLATMAGLDRDTRVVVAVLAAAYMAAPFTEPFPLATMTSALGRYVDS